jgi:hypothetical protein
MACNYAASRYRYETLSGKQYLVVPMTMIVPGVLNGSKGPLLYPHDEVNKDPTPWNKIPITLNHPVREGRNVSAHFNGVLDEQGIGFVDRASSGKKLTGEAWIDVARANKLDRRIVANVLGGKRIEISTGLFTDHERAPEGSIDLNGRSYDWIARNYRPDHLAVLLDQTGACSISDGCGLGVNSEGVKMKNEDLDMLAPPIIGIIANDRRAELEQLRIDKLALNSANSLSGERQPLIGDAADIRDMTMPRLNWTQLARRT